MLHHFGCNNEVVLSLKQYGFGCEEGVINFHGMSSLFEHHRECWSRARAEIEAATLRGQTLRQRDEKAAQKTTIARIIHTIVVLVVY